MLSSTILPTLQGFLVYPYCMRCRRRRRMSLLPAWRLGLRPNSLLAPSVLLKDTCKRCISGKPKSPAYIGLHLIILHEHEGYSGINSCQNCSTILDRCRLCRLPSVQLASVPLASKQVIEGSPTREAIRTGTLPLWANTSRTTLRVCSSADRPGLPSTGCPSSRHLPSDL
jgi:hypothetical protein